MGRVAWVAWNNFVFDIANDIKGDRVDRCCNSVVVAMAMPMSS